MKRFRRAVRYYLLRFLRLRGTPWKVALGFALGACVNFYPTFGVGILLAGLLASVSRVSITAALLGDVIFKSFFPLFFYFNLRVGNLLLGQKPAHLLASLRQLLVLNKLHLVDLGRFGKIFFLGAFVNTLILGGTLTLVIYLLFSTYRPQMVHYVYYRKKRK